MNKKQNTTPIQKFFGEFVVQADGKIKCKMAKRHAILSPNERTWHKTNAREFARLLNRSQLIIK